MDPLHRIAEKKIEEALAQGAFDDYAGKGEPLELEDVSRLDPEVRAAYLVLKGHGYVSEESQLRADLVSMRALLAAVTDDGERDRWTREERRLRLRFSLLLEKRGVPFDVIERLARGVVARARDTEPGPWSERREDVAREPDVSGGERPSRGLP